MRALPTLCLPLFLFPFAGAGPQQPQPVQAAPAQPAPRSMRPAVAFAGAQSRIEMASWHRLQNAQDLARIWLQNLGRELPQAGADYGFYYNDAAVPEVDFECYEVIAVFAGKGWNSAGIQAIAVQDEKECRRFRFDHRSYQTMGPDGGGVRVCAFGFFVLPKTELPIVLEEDVQNLIGKPPVWKERARL